jgi:hypothetical protein
MLFFDALHFKKVQTTLKYTQPKYTKKTEMAAEKNKIKCPTKQINNNNKDVPIGTKDKVYSAVFSPSNNCYLMMAHVRPKHVAAMNKECTYLVTF